VTFDAAELKLPELGYMVENNVLQLALWQALTAHERITLGLAPRYRRCSGRRPARHCV
jgi:2-polyprenyl-6-methoxyphenol hydroxylase-like FAD-dependent oxidoreductase